MKTAIAMAGLALAAGLAAAGPEPWHPLTRVAAVRLGVRVVGTRGQLRETLGVEAGKGALVLEVEAEGPAARAGVQAGDVLTDVAGKPVGNAAEILDALADRKPGAAVPLQYVRDREVRAATVTLAGARQRRTGFPWFEQPEGLPRAWRGFQDRIERELKELDERLRRLEEHPGVDRTSSRAFRPVGLSPPGQGGC